MQLGRQRLELRTSTSTAAASVVYRLAFVTVTVPILIDDKKGFLNYLFLKLKTIEIIRTCVGASRC